MTQINRRDFLAGATVALCACASCPAAKGKASGEPVDLGPLTDFKDDGINSKWAQSHEFFVVRSKGRIYAPSAICTHKRAALDVDGNRFECPKHGSLFELTGKPIKAPASRSLPRYGIRVDDRGHLIVDPDQRFDEKRWGDGGASVAAGA